MQIQRNALWQKIKLIVIKVNNTFVLNFNVIIVQPKLDFKQYIIAIVNQLYQNA